VRAIDIVIALTRSRKARQIVWLHYRRSPAALASAIAMPLGIATVLWLGWLGWVGGTHQTEPFGTAPGSFTTLTNNRPRTEFEDRYMQDSPAPAMISSLENCARPKRLIYDASTHAFGCLSR
jgi:hypothetical protein